jgi:hypothetical protein
MEAHKFNPDRPSGIGVDGDKRWITQGPWKFDPLTKELLPGQIPTEVPPEARVAQVAEGAAGADLPEGEPEPERESIAFKASQAIAETFTPGKKGKKGKTDG